MRRPLLGATAGALLLFANALANALLAQVPPAAPAPTAATWPDPAADLTERGVVALEQGLVDVGTIGRVLNLAAHPDDEDGGTLALLRHGRGLRTFVAFANRGEGGQNEIGPELYRELGALRESETLRACRRLGAQARFLGLEDFGFSKRAEEAFERWGGSERVVERLVYAIRATRPDVVFTNHDPDTGHGQHRAMAIAARDAFDRAGDPAAFPEHAAAGLEPWAPALLLERVRDEPGAPPEATAPPDPDVAWQPLRLDAVDPIRGTTYVEQAHRALKEHASQGRWEQPGSAERRFRVVKRRDERFLRPGEDPFDPVNLTRLRLFRAIDQGLLDRDQQEALLDPAFFPRVLGPDGGDRTSLPAARDGAALAEALLAFAARVEALGEPAGFVRDDLAGVLAIVRDLVVALEPRHAAVAGAGASPGPQAAQPPVAPAAPPTDPLFASALYDAFDPLARPWRRAAVAVDFAPRHRVLRAAAHGTTAAVQALALVDVAQPLAAPLALHLEVGGRAVWSATIPADAAPGPEDAAPRVRLVPIEFAWPEEAPPGTLRFELRADGDGGGGVQQLVPFAATMLDVQVAGEPLVGVVRSYDDTLENALRDLGARVRRLGADDLAFRDLAAYDAILVDIRAYLVRDDLRRFNARLLDYVARGGVLGVFYQKTMEWNPDGFAPLPLRLTTARVVDEAAPVALLAPDHPLLSAPNAIAPDSFAGWVHERGLYFPKDSYDPAYVELVETHDAGEEPLRGGLLAVRHGEGVYVYTSLAWYRQWLNGHAGAYAFLANLVSLRGAGALPPSPPQPPR